MAIISTTIRSSGAVALALVLGLSMMDPTAARAETVVRVAMTAADIPDWTGVPDQGYEGYRFAGYTLYDAITNWDLSRSDVAADIKPGLATSWSVDPNDHQKWTFKLREGVKFHDGCAWNADAMLWNFARVSDKSAKQFNPRHYAAQHNQVVNIDRMEKVDDFTVIVHTSVIDSLLPYEVSSYFQISPCAVEAAGYDYAKYAQHPAGTGPYKFDRVVPHERLELVKNPDYWDAARVPKHDRLVLLPMPEASTRAAALLAGQVDFVEAPSPDTIPRLEAAGMQIIKVPYPHNWNYLIRVDRPPFNDLRVRQAANYAINRDELVEMLQGVATAGDGIFISSQPYFGKPMTYTYDPDKAKALLKEAGCDPCKMTIGISTSGSGQMQPLPMNELVKEQLEAVGFQVDIQAIDWNALIDVFIGGVDKFPQYDGINFSLAPIEPMQGILKTTMTRYQTPNGINWGRYSNPDVDKLGEAAMLEFDVDKRNAILGKMHELVVADAYNIFIAHDLNPRALSPRLKGFVQAQSWFQDLTPIEVVDPTN